MGNAIQSLGKANKSAVRTIVERKIRFNLIIKLKFKKALEVASECSEILNVLDKKWMTYDNGIEKTRHKIITENTRIKIYVAHLFFLRKRN